MIAVIVVIIAWLNNTECQDTNELDFMNLNNCSTVEDFGVPENLTLDEPVIEDTFFDEILSDETRENVNVSHLKTSSLPKDWEKTPSLKFPKTSKDDRYKMASLHLDKGYFVFDFLRSFLLIVQPNDVPIGKSDTKLPKTESRKGLVSKVSIPDLLRDVLNDRITVTNLVSQVSLIPSEVCQLAKDESHGFVISVRLRRSRVFSRRWYLLHPGMRNPCN